MAATHKDNEDSVYMKKLAESGNVGELTVKEYNLFFVAYKNLVEAHGYLKMKGDYHGILLNAVEGEKTDFVFFFRGEKQVYRKTNFFFFES